MSMTTWCETPIKICRPIMSNLEILMEWLNESKVHDTSNNTSRQEIDGDTVYS